MSLTYKKAALLVLLEKQTALNYHEIYNEAAKQEFLHTTGSTPVNTMYSMLYKEVKVNKDRSFFSRDNQGRFYLNPKYSWTRAKILSLRRFDHRLVKE